MPAYGWKFTSIASYTDLLRICPYVYVCICKVPPFPPCSPAASFLTVGDRMPLLVSTFPRAYASARAMPLEFNVEFVPHTATIPPHASLWMEFQQHRFSHGFVTDLSIRLCIHLQSTIPSLPDRRRCRFWPSGTGCPSPFRLSPCV